MAIAIVPKEKKAIPSWQLILFYVSLILLVAIIASYFILNNFQKKYTVEIQDLDNQLAQFKTQERVKLEDKVSSWEKKINNFSTILDEHLFISRVFELVEDTTHPKVSYTKFDLTPNNNALELSGKTDNFVTLGQQIILIQEDPRIEKLDLVKISLTKENKVEFDLVVSLKPEIFVFQ